LELSKIREVVIYPLRLPVIKPGDNVPSLILESMEKENISIENGDVVVVAHTIISRAEKCQYFIPEVIASPFAEIISRKTGKDPSLVELILQESKTLLKVERNIIISKHNQGWICANAAVDQSNAPPNHALTLPKDPSYSAKEIWEALYRKYKKNIGVLISDTHGRALRRGAINVAIGAHNFPVIDDVRGRKDIFGYELKSTLVALADEICSAAELVMGQADEGIPVAIVKGVKWRSPIMDITHLQYSDEQRLFT